MKDNFPCFCWLTILSQSILFETKYVSNNYDPDQSDCSDILSGLILVQTVFKGHYTTSVGAALNLQRQLLSDLNTLSNFEKLKGLPCVRLFVRLKNKLGFEIS